MINLTRDILTDNHFLMQEFVRGKDYALEVIMTRYHGAMTHLASFYLPDPSHVEPLVIEVFVKLWYNRRYLQNLTDIEVFLFKHISKECILALRQLRDTAVLSSTVVDNLTATELKDLMHRHIFETRVLMEALHLLQTNKQHRKGKTGQQRRGPL